ncbi:hypothetical protein Tco_0245944 [Tanacetum coccineum]
MILGSLKKFKKQSPKELKPRSKDTRRTSGNTTRNDPFPPFLIIEAQTQVVIRRCLSNRSTFDIEDLFLYEIFLPLLRSTSRLFAPVSLGSNLLTLRKTIYNNMISTIYSLHQAILTLLDITTIVLLIPLMPPKRTSTSETPAITLDAIRQLTADFTAALEAQTAAMASASNLLETPAVKKGKLLIGYQCQPFCFNGRKELLALFTGLECTKSVFSEEMC